MIPHELGLLPEEGGGLGLDDRQLLHGHVQPPPPAPPHHPETTPSQLIVSHSHKIFIYITD